MALELGNGSNGDILSQKVDKLSHLNILSLRWNQIKILAYLISNKDIDLISNKDIAALEYSLTQLESNKDIGANDLDLISN